MPTQTAQRSPPPSVEPADPAGLAADFVWRTDAGLRIERFERSSGRCPKGVERAFRGARLDRLVAAIDPEADRLAVLGLLERHRELRDVGLPLSTSDQGTVYLVLRATPLVRGGSFAGYQGTGQVWGARPFDDRQRRELAILLDKTEAARAREHRLRRETEALLASLQVLQRPVPLAEKCREIFAVFADLLRHEEALAVRRGINGRLVLTVATDPGFAGIDWPESPSTAKALSGEAVVIEDLAAELDRPLAEPLGSAARAVAIAPLRIGKEAALLIAVHREPGFFDGSALAMMRRLGLIATQAFQDEERKSHLANSSKLASLGELMATIAHEINQPLSVISMASKNAQMMLDRGKTAAEIVPKLERIGDQVERASEIVAALRTFGYPDRAGSAAEPIDVRGLVRSLEVLIEGSLKKRQIALTLTVAEGSRPISGSIPRLQQVLVNLLTNARDAIGARIESGALSEPGRIAIDVADEGPAGGIVLRVADNGGGIPAELMEAVFDPFFTLKEVGKGNGLGLAICRSLLEDMNGSIRVHNDDRGAVFEIRMPAAEAGTGEPS